MPDTKVQEQMKCMMKHKIVMETLRIRHFFLFFKISGNKKIDRYHINDYNKHKNIEKVNIRLDF